MADSMTWIDPGGTSHPFDGSTLAISIPRGSRQGMFMPPIALVDQRTPLRPGTIVRYVDVQARPLIVPVLVNPGVESTLRTTIHSMTKWFNTPAGSPGTWQATGPDGSVRNLVCYYQSGLHEAAETDEVRKPGAMYFALTFMAADPFWYDTSATVINYTNTQLLAGVTINNTSDFLVWPTWTFASPMTNLVITNTTTGLAIKLTANGGLSMPSGHNLVINTLAGTVIEDVTNVIQFLTTDSVLFPLVTGNNVLTFSYTGGVLGTTTGQVSYTNRWFSA